MQDSLQTTLTGFQQISSTRRHLYVFTLLFLGATVLTDIWRSANADELASTQEVVRIQRIAEAAMR
jgi:hypothetical protein